MKILLLKKILSGLISGLIALGSTLSLIPEARAQESAVKQTFIITAYYSPLPNQEHYVTGTYEGDKRLNGNGVVGADLTPVYEGMIAAPSHIPFGTKVSCPPFINGTVHDRGGAIVKAGKRGHSYDRLDFWAGKGEEAMKTALVWGKRTMDCTVYTKDHSLDQYVNLPKGELSLLALKYFKKSASFSISKYETLLTELGYDTKQLSAKIAFQIRHEIIASEKDLAAGTIGPNTRKKLDQIGEEIIKKLPSEKLSFGAVGEGVRRLQGLLSGLEYLAVSPTGKFGEQTLDALIRFQLDQKLVDSRRHPAAGYVGPGTLLAFKKHLLKSYSISKDDENLITKLEYGEVKAALIAKAEELAEKNPNAEIKSSKDPYQSALELLSHEWLRDHETDGQSPALDIRLATASFGGQKEYDVIKQKLLPIVLPFTKHLGPGIKDPAVSTLQEFLKDKGYFTGDFITDTFGVQTKKALMAFQWDRKIIQEKNSSEAGILGSKTMMALNNEYIKDHFSPPKIFSNLVKGPAIHPDDVPKIPVYTL